MVILLLLIVILICLLPAGESRKTSEPEPIKKKKKSVQTKPDVTVTAEPAEEPLEFVPLTKDQTKGIVSSSADPAEATIISSKAAAAAKKEVRADVKNADIVAPAAKKDKIRPKMLEYPSGVEGGIYGDTFIGVDDDVVLKLRTLVVEDIYLL